MEIWDRIHYNAYRGNEHTTQSITHRENIPTEIYSMSIVTSILEGITVRWEGNKFDLHENGDVVVINIKKV